jgi:hypothetical protein
MLTAMLAMAQAGQTIGFSRRILKPDNPASVAERPGVFVSLITSLLRLGCCACRLTLRTRPAVPR